MKIIESKDNSTYKKLVKLKSGDASAGLFLAEGSDLFEEAKKAAAIKLKIYPLSAIEEVDADDETIFIKDGLYRELSTYKSLPKIITLCQKRYASDYGKRVIYLDGIQDPGNCGTIIRTALSFGYSSVVLSKDSVSLYNNKVVQSSKGALFNLSVGREDLEVLKSEGYHLYLTTLDGKDERNFQTLEKPFCLVFGNEGTGIRKSHLALGEHLKIEMSGIDSLNVAVASGIFMYRFQRS